MSLVYQHNINDTTKLGVWHISEDEKFFLQKVPLGREIKHWHKRLQHLAGRYLLQEMFPNFPYHLIEIANTRKPFLPTEEYHFSISHCGDYAAALVSKDQRVGVDIELATDRVFRVMHKFLHNEELEFADQTVQGLTLLWSLKEAMFKWYGSGEVDFKEHLKINRFHFQSSGKVDTEVIKGEISQLTLEYRITNDYVLAWTI